MNFKNRHSKPKKETQVVKKQRRRFILFARAHETRNAFELSVAALSECVRMRILDPLKWEFLGVGGLDSKPICNLGDRGNNACIKMIQSVPEREYKRILEGGDIGLSLTLSPNPSFSAFDFAAAGMIVVTNSFETRTQETFDELGEHFIVAKPSLVGIINGISRALLKIENMRKQKNWDSKLNLPTNWSDERCYGKALFNKVKLWFKDHTIFPFEFEKVEI